MVAFRIATILGNKQERKSDVTYAAGDPDGQKEEEENAEVGGACSRVEGHHHVEERGPGAQEDVSGVRNVCARQKVGKYDGRDGQRVDQPPVFNEADVGFAMRKFQQAFSPEWDERVAQRSDPDRAQIANQ